ncbi:TIGR02594 family protein [Flammeovirga yaeyamensis]|uniref:N-acetylmuramoyl-L-alanine amidase n=1 Tax=Flammeovirga yaeyamensis TaxID=367791 RepID=A0AAX1N6G2_9BACT|nr:SH3 domain-containing C40 family peptidase [Flammeovirga yaeyamensis]MBB3697633.1 uncharacterized protein (TIGR02594 family) [Flammeovirga yaeyamensis]NMF36006.1 TIGR02594 family protein [Flammeovirga yaeyamensis]QWG03049.1 TIGR02594 family protein [Flammeovirga yaeyamensis]
MKQFIVKAKALNIRKMPTVNSDSIGYLSMGDVIDVHKFSGDGKWVGFIRVTGNEKQKGWASLKFLYSLENDNLIRPDDFPWTELAIREMGTREYYGNADNPRIVQYLMSTENINYHARSNDETAWCSAFVNWCMETCGFEGTNTAWARHWLNWGEPISHPVRGCVTVFKRGSGGHVGFFIKETETSIFVLGGNQDDEVNIKEYNKDRLLGYRLIKIPG